jgi:TetR/AcrR family transcriptional regulator, mexCD-oprJ operon repressor
MTGESEDHGRTLRADAQRSRDAIADAVLRAVGSGERLSMAAIARAAGVSRVTLYSHFPTLEAAVGVAVERALSDARAATSDLDMSGAPPRALADLVASHWESLARFQALYAAAAELLDPRELRALHDPLFGSVGDLIRRGQAAGDFRADLPAEWLIASIYALMHQAADELSAGRLSRRQVPRVLIESVLALTAPTSTAD